MFNVVYEKQRHVVLDHYPLLYYLWKDKDKAAYVDALSIANHLQELLRLVDPDGGEYVTIIALNEEPAAPQDATEQQPAQLSPLDNPSPSDETAQLQARLAALQAEMEEQSIWARSLEENLKEREAEVDRLQTHIRRIADGRVMRLLDKLPGRKNRP